MSYLAKLGLTDLLNTSFIYLFIYMNEWSYLFIHILSDQNHVLSIVPICPQRYFIQQTHISTTLLTLKSLLIVTCYVQETEK